MQEQLNVQDISKRINIELPYLKPTKYYKHGFDATCKKCGRKNIFVAYYQIRNRRKYSLCPYCKAVQYAHKYNQDRKVLKVYASKSAYGSPMMIVKWRCRKCGHVGSTGFGSFCTSRKVACYKCQDKQFQQDEQADADSWNIMLLEAEAASCIRLTNSKRIEIRHIIRSCIKAKASYVMKAHHLSTSGRIRNKNGQPIMMPEYELLVHYKDFKFYKHKLYVHVQCTKCHTKFYADLTSLIHNKIACPYCMKRASKGETVVGRYLHSIGFPEYDGADINDFSQLKKHKYGFKYRCQPRELLGLHLDFLIKMNNQYYPVEYDGYQHFAPIKIFGGQKGYEERHADDLAKNKLCLKHYGRYPIRIKDLYNHNDYKHVRNRVKNSLCIFTHFNKSDKPVSIYIDNNYVKPKPRPKISPHYRKELMTQEAEVLQRKRFKHYVTNLRQVLRGCRKSMASLASHHAKVYKMERYSIYLLVKRMKELPSGYIKNKLCKKEIYRMSHKDATSIFGMYAGWLPIERKIWRRNVKKTFHTMKPIYQVLCLLHIHHKEGLLGLHMAYDDPLSSYTNRQIGIIYLSGKEPFIAKGDSVLVALYKIKYNKVPEYWDL